MKIMNQFRPPGDQFACSGETLSRGYQTNIHTLALVKPAQQVARYVLHPFIGMPFGFSNQKNPQFGPRTNSCARIKPRRMPPSFEFIHATSAKALKEGLKSLYHKARPQHVKELNKQAL